MRSIDLWRKSKRGVYALLTILCAAVVCPLILSFIPGTSVPVEQPALASSITAAGGGDTWRAGLCMGGVCAGDTANGWWMPAAANPRRCSLTAVTAPVAPGISVDVLKNGTTTIFTSPIALAAGQHVVVVTTFAAVSFNGTTDYATVQLTGVSGSGVVLSCLFQ